MTVDLSSPAFKKEAYTLYRELREKDPAYAHTMTNGQRAWLLTRYDDAVLALKNDEHISKNSSKMLAAAGGGEQAIPSRAMNLITRNMLTTDPPDHTRLRAIVSKAFTPRMIEELHVPIEAVVQRLIREMKAKGSVELVEDFAFPLPIYVICQMLGIPEEDHTLFRDWSDQFVAAATDVEKVRGVIPAIHAFDDYISEVLEDRRRTPRGDMISHLVHMQENGDRLSREELASTIFLLIVAGHETTVNLLGNGTLALLENPDQLAAWRAAPEQLTPTAVEELLRYYSPVELTTNRYVVKEFILHGRTLQPGDLLFVSLASANRDPAQFDEPERLELGRRRNKHIAFGNGIHFCLGAPLARLEAQLAFTALIRELPDLRLAVPREELAWRAGTLMRGLERLPVSV